MTNGICKRFIFAGFIFFIIGTTLGFLMFSKVIPEESPAADARIEMHEEGEHEASHSASTFVHAHMGVYGWVSLFIFGVSYKLIPTAFAGKTKVYSFRMARAHFWMAIPGLSGVLLFGYLSEFSDSALLHIIQVALGALFLTSGFVFVINMWKTFTHQQGASSAREKPPSA